MNQAVHGCTALSGILTETGATPFQWMLQMFSKVQSKEQLLLYVVLSWEESSLPHIWTFFPSPFISSRISGDNN